MPTVLFSDPIPCRPIDEIDLPWWGLWFRTFQEKKIIKELQDNLIDFYMPMSVLRRPGPVVYKPLFNGYLFVASPWEKRTVVLKLGKPIEIKQQERFKTEIMNIQLAIAHDPMLSALPINSAKKGDSCRVINGSMRGLVGQFEKFQGRIRLILNLTILGQCVQVELDVNDVELIEKEQRNQQNYSSQVA